MSKFKYFNASPNQVKRNDCVIRALSTALGIGYFEIEDALLRIGDYYDCEELNVACYRRLLTNGLGLQEYKGDGRTVGEVSDDHPNDDLIIRIEGHATVSLQNCIYDLFDCRDEICDRYWIVERY